MNQQSGNKVQGNETIIVLCALYQGLPISLHSCRVQQAEATATDPYPLECWIDAVENSAHDVLTRPAHNVA